jgi:hypothetical protein
MVNGIQRTAVLCSLLYILQRKQEMKVAWVWWRPPAASWSNQLTPTGDSRTASRAGCARPDAEAGPRKHVHVSACSGWQVHHTHSTGVPARTDQPQPSHTTPHRDHRHEGWPVAVVRCEYCLTSNPAVKEYQGMRNPGCMASHGVLRHSCLPAAAWHPAHPSHIAQPKVQLATGRFATPQANRNKSI